MPDSSFTWYGSEPRAATNSGGMRYPSGIVSFSIDQHVSLSSDSEPSIGNVDNFSEGSPYIARYHSYGRKPSPRYPFRTIRREYSSSDSEGSFSVSVSSNFIPGLNSTTIVRRNPTRFVRKDYRPDSVINFESVVQDDIPESSSRV